MYSNQIKIMIIGAALCCTFYTLKGQNFISKGGVECLFTSDYPCENSMIYPGFCDIIPNLTCPTCPPTVDIRKVNITQGSLTFNDSKDTMFTIMTWFFTAYDIINEQGEHFFSPTLLNSRIQPQDHFRGLFPYQDKFFVTSSFRYGIFDPITDQLDTRLYDLQDQGQTALVQYKDELIGIKTSDVDQSTGRLFSDTHRHVLYRYDIDDFLAYPEKIIELDHSFKVGNIINGQKMTAAQIHCEDVRLYYNGPTLCYFYPDSPTVYEECDVFLFNNDNSTVAVDFPEWCDCQLSIDLDLNDEPVQFNRDFSYDADCHTDLRIVDEDVQVFASVGAIDSITILLKDADPSQYLTATSSSATIIISGDQTHRITLINNGTASFDDYEDVMKTILYIDTNDAIINDIEIDFQAYHKAMESTISTTRISIPNVTMVNSIDTTITSCMDMMLPIDASQFLKDSLGTWFNGESIFDPAVDDSGTQLLYFHEDICNPDTSVIEFIVLPPVQIDNLMLRACHEDSINVSGQYYYQDTILQDTILSVLSSCDSVYQTRHLAFDKAPSLIVEDFSLCNGDSILIGQEYIKESMQSTDTIVNTIGCDSIINVVIVVVREPAVTIIEDIALCRGDSVMIANEIVNTTGEYETTTYSLIDGCDSIITTYKVTVSAAAEFIEENANLCYGDSIVIGGNWIYTSGIYTDTLRDERSCDTLMRQVTLSVQALPITTMIDTALCDVIVIDDVSITESGIYADTLFNEEGCDSLYLNYNVYDSESVVTVEDQTYEASIGEEIILDIEHSEDIEVMWNPSEYLSCDTCLSPIILTGHQKTQIYEVTIINKNLCQESLFLTLNLNSESVPNAFYIPNVLSQSSLGNTTFYVQGNNQINMTYDMVIYDRWGGIMHQKNGLELNNQLQGWDIANSLAKTGVYVYVIKIGNEIYTGSLTII